MEKIHEDGSLASLGKLDMAPHPQMKVYMPMDRSVGEYGILRRKKCK